MYTATIPGLAGKTMLTDLERRRTAYGLNARELMSSPRLKAGASLGVFGERKSYTPLTSC